MIRKLLITATTSVALALISACPADTGAPDRPADALKKALDAAKAEDVEGFKRGISKNYISVIEQYQAMSKDVPELKAAFEWKAFMKSLVLDDPIPQEEVVKDSKAVVKAARTDGVVVQIQMVLEHGVWKIEVPAGLVTKLDHFDEVIKMQKGEAVPARPDINRGGGGAADRVKKLPADATPIDRKRAAGLDAFDLGDLAGASKTLAEVRAELPDDEEVAIALGRAFVQTKKGEEALAVFEDFLAKHPDSHRAHHYAGMAYLFENRAADAANAWREVIKIDGTYAAEWKLDQRIKAAEQMAKVQATGRAADPGGAVSQPAGGGAASQPGH